MKERYTLYEVELQRDEDSIQPILNLNSSIKELPEEVKDEIIKTIESCTNTVLNIIQKCV